MIHRIALLVGGAGAAGVLALALSLNGSPPTTTDALVPVANNASADQLAQVATDPQAQANPGTDQNTRPVTQQIDTIYVLPAPKPDVIHTNKPAGGNDNPADTPRPRGNGGDSAAGQDGPGDEADDSSDDQAGGDDEHTGGDRSDDGGSDRSGSDRSGSDGGHEPGDD